MEKKKKGARRGVQVWIVSFLLVCFAFLTRTRWWTKSASSEVCSSENGHRLTMTLCTSLLLIKRILFWFLHLASFSLISMIFLIKWLLLFGYSFCLFFGADKASFLQVKLNKPRPAQLILEPTSRASILSWNSLSAGQSQEMCAIFVRRPLCN